MNEMVIQMKVQGSGGEGGGEGGREPSLNVIFLNFFCFFSSLFTGGELLKYTYTLFGGNYCLNGQKTKRGRKKKSLLFWGF